MMKKFSFLVAIIAFTTIALHAQTNIESTTTFTDNLADVKRAIDKGNAQWSDGWAKGDAAMVAAVFENEGVQLATGGKIIKGQQHIMERQKAAMAGADPGVKVSVVTETVWLDGDTAYEMGKYKYEYTVKGKPGRDEGRYFTIWRHQKDGSWKLSMDMGVPKD